MQTIRLPARQYSTLFSLLHFHFYAVVASEIALRREGVRGYSPYSFLNAASYLSPDLQRGRAGVLAISRADSM